MLRWVTQAGSPYLSEGSELIMSEFGKDNTNYLSILQLIASGMTTQSEIDGIIGKNTGAYLDNLEEDYSYIHRKQLMFSKPNGRNSRFVKLYRHPNWPVNGEHVRASQMYCIA